VFSPSKNLLHIQNLDVKLNCTLNWGYVVFSQTALLCWIRLVSSKLKYDLKYLTMIPILFAISLKEIFWKWSLLKTF
jgi:hypothetical protein